MLITQNVNNKYNKIKNLPVDMVTAQEINYLHLPDSIPVDFIKKNLIEGMEKNLTKSEIKVLNCLFYFRAKYEIIHVSHSKIAEIIDCDRRTVIRAMHKLRKLGLISTMYRHRDTCLYKISSFILDFYRLNLLKKIFSNVENNIIKLSLYFLPLFFLTSSITSVNVTQLKKVNYINNNNLDYVSNVQKNQLGGSVLNKNLKENKTTYKNLGNVIESELGLWENSENKLQVANKFRILSRYNMDDIIKRISERLELNFDQEDRLKKFSKSVLLKSEYRFINNKENISSPIPYFFGICYKIQRLENNRSSGENNKSTSYNSSVSKITIEQRQAEDIELRVRLDAIHNEKKRIRRTEFEENNKNNIVVKPVEREKINSEQFNKLFLEAMQLPSGYFRDTLLDLLSKKYEVIYEKAN